MPYLRLSMALVAVSALALSGCEDESFGPGEGGGRGPQAAGAAAAPAGPVSHEGPGRVHQAAKGFSFVPPVGWTPMPDAPPTFSTYGSAPQGNFRDNVNVNITPTQWQSLDVAPAELKAALPKVINGWRFVEDGFTVINGRRAYWICGEWQMNQLNIRCIQYLLPASNRQSYVLSFSTTADRYAEAKPIFQQCAGTVLVD